MTFEPEGHFVWKGQAGCCYCLGLCSSVFAGTLRSDLVSFRLSSSDVIMPAWNFLLRDEQSTRRMLSYLNFFGDSGASDNNKAAKEAGGLALL